MFRISFSFFFFFFNDTATTEIYTLSLHDALPITDEVVTQFPMGDVEKVGLVKFDLLGLKTLTMIAHAERLINAATPDAPVQPFSVANLPLNDPQTFALLSSGKTLGLFQ